MSDALSNVYARSLYELAQQAGGEAKITDTPKGLPVKLDIGSARTVSVTQRLVATTALAGRRRRGDWEVSVVNALSVPATVEVVHPADGSGFKLVSASRRHTVDAGDPMWTLTVPPGGREVVTYRVEIGR